MYFDTSLKTSRRDCFVISSPQSPTHCIVVYVYISRISMVGYRLSVSTITNCPHDTGEGSIKVSRVDEDPFEKEMRPVDETSTEEVRVSYVNPKALDQLEEWMKEKPIPYISNDKFSQEDIFQYWAGRLSGHAHVNQTYPDVVRMWRQFHGCPASGPPLQPTPQISPPLSLSSVISTLYSVNKHRVTH